jgi:hypothetical protein
VGEVEALQDGPECLVVKGQFRRDGVRGISDARFFLKVK